MKVGEIEQTLVDSAGIRFPTIDKDETLGMQIECVQDYLVRTAQIRADLERSRMWAHMAHRKLRREWDELEGWEIHLVNKSRPTNDQVRAAKRTLRPDLADGMYEAEWLIQRISEQIERLELDDKAASRVYTMLVGG